MKPKLRRSGFLIHGQIKRGSIVREKLQVPARGLAESPAENDELGCVAATVDDVWKVKFLRRSLERRRNTVTDIADKVVVMRKKP